MKTYKLVLGGLDMLAAAAASLTLAIKKKSGLQYGFAAGFALMGALNLLDAAQDDKYPDIYGGQV